MLGRPGTQLPITSGCLPATARQSPETRLSPFVMSDDVLLVFHAPHWFYATPLEISATNPPPLGMQEHSFCYLQPPGAATGGPDCACCNPNERQWDLPTGQTEVGTFNVTTVTQLSQHLVSGKWTRGNAARSRVQRSMNYEGPPAEADPALPAPSSSNLSPASSTNSDSGPGQSETDTAAPTDRRTSTRVRRRPPTDNHLNGRTERPRRRRAA